MRARQLNLRSVNGNVVILNASHTLIRLFWFPVWADMLVGPRFGLGGLALKVR
jgi:hypothetical protein